MNAYNTQMTSEQEQKLSALESWHRALENSALRMNCPDGYHEELLRQADEMDRQHLVSWEEYRDLRKDADDAYLHAVAGGDYFGGR